MTIEEIYKGGTLTILSHNIPEIKTGSISLQRHSPSQSLQWPKITAEVEEDVVTQLHQSISLNDNQGMFHVLETEFEHVHERPE